MSAKPQNAIEQEDVDRAASTQDRHSREIMFKRITRFAFVVIALAAYALAFTGSRGLWEPDEGRYSAISLQMVNSGDWWIPRLHPDVPHFAKPPMTYWLVAASLTSFGHTELAVRLPGAMAFVGTILLVFFIAGRLREPCRVTAAAIYATSLLPFAAATVVSTDTILTLWETLAAFGFIAAITQSNDRVRRNWMALMWLGFGLAFATKGPPGLLPLLAFVTYSALTGGWRSIRQMASPLGLGVFVAVGFFWYAAIIVADPEMFRYFVVYEVIDRIFSGTHQRNPGWYQGFRIYLPAIVLGALPWILFAAPAVRKAKVLFAFSTWQRWRRENSPTFLLILWILLPLVIFFSAQSRLILYVLPLFVPLSILIARMVVLGLPKKRARAIAVAAGVIFFFALKAGAPFAPTSKDIRKFAATIREVVPEPIDEVVIVNAANRYGLSFYLDADVEHVALDAEDVVNPRYDRYETVAQELEDREQNRLFLVPERDSDQFDSVVAEIAPEISFRDTVGRFRLYWLADRERSKSNLGVDHRTDQRMAARGAEDLPSATGIGPGDFASEIDPQTDAQQR